MRGLISAAVLVVVLAGCGSDSSGPQPRVEDLLASGTTDLRCDQAEMVLYPADAPVSASCTWRCVSYEGTDLIELKLVFSRPTADDPWPVRAQGYFATPGSCR